MQIGLFFLVVVEQGFHPLVFISKPIGSIGLL